MTVIVDIETVEQLDGRWSWKLLLIGESGASPIVHGVELFPTADIAEAAARDAVIEIARSASPQKGQSWNRRSRRH